MMRELLDALDSGAERYPEVEEKLEENKQVASKHCTCSTDPSITCIVHPRGRRGQVVAYIEYAANLIR